MTAKAKPILSTVVEVSFGWIGLARSASGLRLVTLPEARREDCMALIEAKLGRTMENHEAFGDLPARLAAYFGGEPVGFPDPLDPAAATPFRQAAWLAARTIPYAETRSYAWLAKMVGKPGGARAMGQAMGANPLPIIIPCHRVVGSDGNLCGFGGGLDMKERLLRLEGAL